MDTQIQQIIDRFTTAHGYNRWLDASELEQLLNNFVEDLRKAGLLMPTLSAGALALCQERERQITQKGFTAQHDHFQPLLGFVQAALYYTECGFFAYRHRNDSDCIERMVSDTLSLKTSVTNGPSYGIRLTVNPVITPSSILQRPELSSPPL